MKVPLLDLKAQYEEVKDEIMPVITEVCDNQNFIMGKQVQELEEAIALYCDCKYACGVSSGSDALLISLMTENIGVGDEVITTPFTFFASVGAIARVGAKPVFVDIDEENFNLNPELIEDKITDKTKAIMPVHLFGQMANMEKIMEIAEKHNLIVIEDAAQAIGAEYNNKRAGSYGDYGAFSFFPSKNLGAFGDGGIVTTNDFNKFQRLKMFRNHGANPEKKYLYDYVGGNFRLDTLQAGVLLVKLKYLDKWTRGRQDNAEQYKKLFAESKVSDKLRTPVTKPDANRHIYNQFCISVKNGLRDKLKTDLAEAGVGSAIYYPLSLHKQDCFRYLGYRSGDFPVSENIENEILALPVFPEMTSEQLKYVVSVIENSLAD